MVAIHAEAWAARQRLTEPEGMPVLTRWALAARCSTEDQQDPTLSIPRQDRVSGQSLPPGGRIVARFYDIDSGRKDVAVRGAKRAHEAFDIPIQRDGGIQDLLAEARRPDRRFDYVICESISRIARDTHEGTGIERELERAGVMLFAADEPMVMQRRWGKANRRLNRHLKLILAEHQVNELLEYSWNGHVEHTLQGWNSGRPPYGFLGEKHPHPVPARQKEGDTKTRLILDPVRAPVVLLIFTWRVTERLSYQAIADRLNADLDRFPAPDCNNPRIRRGEWNAGSVEGILRNPKYTGHMVWNRVTRPGGKGERYNPRDEWVWSEQPTHEAIVTRDMYDAAQLVGQERFGSRPGAGPNAHPQTRRTYALRSFIYCGHDECGRRMAGLTVKGTVYYACTRRPRYDRELDGHPRRVYAPEARVLPIVADFFATRIFGPDRQALVRDAIGATGDNEGTGRDRQLTAVRRAVDDVARRIDRLVRSLEQTDDEAVARNLQGRIGELEREREAKLAKLAELEATDPMAGRDVTLLDELPMVEGWNVMTAPEATLRRLLETFRLHVRYWSAPRSVEVIVTVDDGAVIGLQELVPDAAGQPGESPCPSAPREPASHQLGMLPPSRG